MARLTWRHIVADAAKATPSHVGVWARSLEFPDRIICTNMFNDITDYGSRKVQVSGHLERCGHFMQHYSDLVMAVSVIQDWNRLGETLS